MKILGVGIKTESRNLGFFSCRNRGVTERFEMKESERRKKMVSGLTEL